VKEYSRFYLFFLLIFFWSCSSYGYQLNGTITDNNQQPISYASVFVENTTHGVASNLMGKYFLELKTGDYRIVFQALGYEKKVVDVSVKGKNITLNVVLPVMAQQLAEIDISADKKDPAYAIIAKAIENRKKYRKQVASYICNVYIKSSLEKEYFKKQEEDTTGTIEKKLTKEKMNFVESYSKVHYKWKNNFKEIKSAYKDISEQYKSVVSISISTDDEDVYESDLVNRNLFKVNIAEADFNFYYNTLVIPSLGPTPFVSPISSTALSYKYRLVETFYENDLWINKIEVIPRREEGALLAGHIYIVENLWNIKAVDLEINKSAIYHFNHFKILQEYENIQDSIWMLSREEFFYNAKEGKKQIIGNTMIYYSEYELNPKFPKNFFNNELRATLDDAYEKDSMFWAETRPITLKEEEAAFVHSQDSITAYHKTPEYLKRQDSIYNHKNIWSYLANGLGYQNSFKKRFSDI